MNRSQYHRGVESDPLRGTTLPCATLRGTNAAILAVAVLTGGTVAFADQAVTTVSDGPYVFWEPDGRARVVALCDGAKSERVVEAGDGFTLHVPCLGLQAVRIESDAPTPDDAVFTGVDRFLAIGDVHGEYDTALALLRAVGVIDDEYRWAFGDGHVLFNGDVFDRGRRVTESLWLIYRLDKAARKAGGRVHMVLGNHEFMALGGDLRYVHAKYLQGVVPALGMGYPELFGPDTELGRWLRTRNTLVMINRLLFTHAGVSADVARLGLSIDEINDLVRTSFDVDRDRLKSDPTLDLLRGVRGPLWYRGYFMGISGYQNATDDDIRTVLDRFGAKRVVVAHTSVVKIGPFHGGLVIGIDVPMSDEAGAQGLLWTDGKFFAVDSRGGRRPIQFD